MVSLLAYLKYLTQTKDSFQKDDKIQSPYVSELTIIKRDYNRTDDQYKIVVEALENFAVSQLFFMCVANGVVDVRLVAQ